MVARAFDAGWAGVFYKTICLQEIKEVSPRFDAIHSNGTRGDFYGFRNMEQLSENPVEMDLDIMKRLKQDYPTKVVVASIMGKTKEEWIKLAKMAEEAGVDAVELNFSCPQMRITGMGSDTGQDPEMVLTDTRSVKNAVKIPVIAKMTPNITHIVQPALSGYLAGADAISAINTIKSVTMEVIKLLSSTARHASHVSWEVNVWVATCVGWCVRQEPLVLPDESPRNKIGIRIPTLTIGVASWLRQSLSRNSG